MDRHTQATLMFEANKKSTLLAYVLWWFLGMFGAHRIYLGATTSGVAMLVLMLISLVLSIVFIGFIGIAFIGVWWLIDAFLIPGLAARANMRLIDTLNHL